MLKLRIIPILTFNGFALVKTKQFANPRMVGNPVQAARVYNARKVDELVFLDIFASQQERKLNLKLVKDVIKECFMPVGIGGGIQSIDDINDLLKIGADKVIIKSKAITDPQFLRQAVRFFGSQCITVSIDVFKTNKAYFIKLNNDNKPLPLEAFLSDMEKIDVGEYILNSVDHDGMMNGFDLPLLQKVSILTNKPIVAVGGAGSPEHFEELFSSTSIEAAGAASIYHFTQFTPMDVKHKLDQGNFPIRLN